ncbi:unnamed product [Ostreococcus tauri]|uniref:Unnamed product n=1 Tax=Ostreococcus tauri TaxID=70448 RepID=A0A090LXP0_OSTTA|nr:unnamed product [Ostreococcus tauri]CEF96650.1 unnamed product [Ostreococcus tauri]|eukprot:XP_003074322.2 unnamed product [Ostreococcus tauri]
MSTSTPTSTSRAHGGGVVRARWRSRSSRVERRVGTNAASADESEFENDQLESKKTLVVIECDGAVVDVHGDGHRVAFNRAFASKGLNGVTWDHAEYASLLRSGGGTPYGMCERYFTFYGYPSAVSPATKRKIENDEYMQAMKRLQEIVPLATDEMDSEDDSEEGRASAEDEKRMREIFLRDLIKEKDNQFGLMIDEHALKIRSGVERFLDDCIRENDKIQVLLVSETGSNPSERVLDAAMHKLGELRAAGISVMNASDLAAPSSMSQAIQKQKGDLLAPEIGGDLQRQNLNSDVIIDAGMFSSSLRSVLTAETITELAVSRGFDPKNVIFIGGALSTCSAASSAGCFSVMVRTQLHRGGEFPGVDSVVDGYGAGEGITLRRILAISGSRSR